MRFSHGARGGMATGTLRIVNSAGIPANYGDMPTMSNTLKATLQRDGDWGVAYCREVPGANGQGRSKQKAGTSLADAIDQVLATKGQTVAAGQPSAPQ